MSVPAVVHSISDYVCEKLSLYEMDGLSHSPKNMQIHGDFIGSEGDALLPNYLYSLADSNLGGRRIHYPSVCFYPSFLPSL